MPCSNCKGPKYYNIKVYNEPAVRFCVKCMTDNFQETIQWFKNCTNCGKDISKHKTFEYDEITNTVYTLCITCAKSYNKSAKKILKDEKGIGIRTYACVFCLKMYSKTKVCSKCKVSRYCSKNCQKADWKDHKNYCDTFEQLNQ